MSRKFEDEDEFEDQDDTEDEDEGKNRKRRGVEAPLKRNREEVGDGDDEYDRQAAAIQRTMDRIEKDKKMYWKPEPGMNQVRIIPNKPTFFAEIPQHFHVGPDNRVFICRSAVHKKCPVCEIVEKWSASDDKKKQRRASDMAVQRNAVMQIVDMKKPKLGLQLWSVTDNMLYKICGFYHDPDFGDFTHPKHGYDFIIRREGTGKGTKYPEVRPRPKASPIVYKKWKAERKDLLSLVKVVDYDTMKDAIFHSTGRGSRDE